ncbi:NAD(P)H-hydrate dehydratase [Treponema sp.]|uniref:NAD(P)H-hydrate dehydratase n=1 Tax=Treponema sp. TaxID=166 RepID=UPI002600B533|nr:NAD(P)H-hydrate dehydratase [Treponema sp.]MCR5217943.1 NAD(P)H-hydrate dehydratase [Treponema sp.]
MEKIYADTRELDKAARETFGLTEDIMMENAAAALEEEVKSYINNCTGPYLSRPTVLVLCGSGNNGGDGYALARRLISHEISVTVCQVFDAKSDMCLLQQERAQKSGVHFISFYELDDFLNESAFDLKVIVDCIFGSGFHGQLPVEAKAVLDTVNKERKMLKLACDIPSGNYFKADVTVTMGALKLPLYTDAAKDMCGTIKLADLGISRSSYENCPSYLHEAFLLEEKDLILPFRKTENVNKGTFGHAVIISGEKTGASVIAGLAALNFGAGLVTLCDKSAAIENKNIPFELMASKDIPANLTALALGMGLGVNNEAGNAYLDYLLENKKVSVLLDADILTGDIFAKKVLQLLESRRTCDNLVLTPHPKEFAKLLKNLDMGDYTTEDVVNNKLELAKKFCTKFEGVTLILKGANVLIAQKIPSEDYVRLYINTFGTAALAKAGSGDVLAGLAAALLAQHKNSLGSAVHASLAHALASQKCDVNYALTPMELISFLKQI